MSRTSRPKQCCQKEFIEFWPSKIKKKAKILTKVWLNFIKILTKFWPKYVNCSDRAYKGKIYQYMSLKQKMLKCSLILTTLKNLPSKGRLILRPIYKSKNEVFSSCKGAIRHLLPFRCKKEGSCLWHAGARRHDRGWPSPTHTSKRKLAVSCPTPLIL